MKVLLDDLQQRAVRYFIDEADPTTGLMPDRATVVVVGDAQQLRGPLEELGIGPVQVIDPATGAVTQRVQVVDPWEEPLDWQQPRPSRPEHRRQLGGPVREAGDAVGFEKQGFG